MIRKSGIPAAIWVLGFVSLLMDISSEMIHSLLPLFLVTGLGTSALAIGLIEGAAEATALIVKVFSGVLSDWIGRRKALATLISEPSPCTTISGASIARAARVRCTDSMSALT